MKKIAYIVITLLIAACSDQKNADTPSTAGYNTDGKTVSVYTTADSTNYRLSSNGTLEFKEKAQPFENFPTLVFN